MDLKAIGGVSVAETAHKLDAREKHFFIRGPIDDLKLFLRHLGPDGSTGKFSPVLYVHGMSFPSALFIAHRFDGR